MSQAIINVVGFECIVGKGDSMISESCYIGYGGHSKGEASTEDVEILSSW